MDIEDLHKLYLKCKGVCTDTRKITQDCLFFALKGPNFNGNTFAEKALDLGAKYVFIDEEQFSKDDNYIVVEDCLKALQQLATYHRNTNKAVIISLTGSNGKTTTKELLHTVLQQKYNTIATIGNLNNHIGVPLTMLRIEPETEIAVVEMGANHQKEIEFLSSIAQPDYGYITNFGKAHLEGFGGVEGVIKGKSELYDYLINNDKSIFINADDPIQLEKTKNHIKKYGFSIEYNDYLNIRLIGSTPTLKIEFEDTIVESQLTGSYNFTNLAIAVLVGKYFNVSESAIKGALESYVPENNRSQLLKKKRTSYYS